MKELVESLSLDRDRDGNMINEALDRNVELRLLKCMCRGEELGGRDRVGACIIRFTRRCRDRDLKVGGIDRHETIGTIATRQFSDWIVTFEDRKDVDCPTFNID